MSKPKQYVDLTGVKLKLLSKDQAQILCAVTEAVIGADIADVIAGGDRRSAFLQLLNDVEGQMVYLKKDTQDSLKAGLTVLESPALRVLMGILNKRKFSRMTLDQRQELLRELKSGDNRTGRQAYVGLSALAGQFFYGHKQTWANEIQYEGVSVDNQQVLDGHRWRPDDPTPTIPCS